MKYEQIKDLVEMLDNTRTYEVTSAVALSSDPYHSPIPLENLYKLMSRRYFSNMKINDFAHGVQARGRGQAIARAFYHDPVTTLEFNDEDSIEMVYVTYDGQILADCDMAFVDMDDVALGNVSEPKIFEQIYERQRHDGQATD